MSSHTDTHVHTDTHTHTHAGKTPWVISLSGRRGQLMKRSTQKKMVKIRQKGQLGYCLGGEERKEREKEVGLRDDDHLR